MARLTSTIEKKADKLLVYLARKIGEHKPKNVVFFIVDILCTYYPRHIPGLSKIWLMDKNLEEQKQHVRELFKRNNSTSGIAQHFINAGFDSVGSLFSYKSPSQLDSLTYLTTDVLDEIQAYNNTTWLPGHKVRVYQIFQDINKIVKAYKDEVKANRMAWQHSDSGIYAQLDGTFVTPKRSGAVWIDSNNNIYHPSPAYYYPKVRPASLMSDAVDSASTVHKPGTVIFQNRQGVPITEPALTRGNVNMSQIANISARITTNKVMDAIMARSNEEATTPDLQESACCRIPTTTHLRILASSSGVQHLHPSAPGPTGRKSTLAANYRALAWDDLCREAIESTAMSAITMDRLRRLKVILRGYDLVDYTWWAGEVKKRIPESAPMHTQPQTDASCVTFDSSCRNGLCLIDATKFFFAKLMNSGYKISAQPTKFEVPSFRYPRDVKFTPADSVKYLVVLLADMHYPFNFDFEGPLSIASRKVDASEHPIWASLCKEKLGTVQPTLEDFVTKVFMPHYIHMNEESWYGAWTNVEVLGTRYKVEQESFNRNTWDNFEIWATETANLNCAMLVTKDDYAEGTNNVKVTDALLERLGMLIRFQIVLAGARIAIVLNYILSHREIAYSEKTGLPIVKNPNDAWKADDYYFVILSSLVIGIILVGLYFISIGMICLFKDSVTKSVDNALRGWRDRRKSKYAPHLDIHED
ncbi:uncharacterized protein BXIN_2053 [Babesia sp. Xinjiang]|uniref:uncharacterized protein n=1 Tax=Babesia sp. Xinjiang TaxID=462227 RepID=UPI000A24CAE1|nr:uncharacterized protein BXIN_2053 [Babesia sp. Xinjiang]ORM40566.1 hypothetical protein BXIN_2053 [Babesia sp. Xinjiang]